MKHLLLLFLLPIYLFAGVIIHNEYTVTNGIIQSVDGCSSDQEGCTASVQESYYCHTDSVTNVASTANCQRFLGNPDYIVYTSLHDTILSNFGK